LSGQVEHHLGRKAVHGGFDGLAIADVDEGCLHTIEAPCGTQALQQLMV